MLPASARAQAMASEHGIVAQTVNGTTIRVEYYRPQLRGRDNLFGTVVKWGEQWTPGANWATTITVDRSVELEGHSLAKGSYSLWMVPQADAPWTVIVSSKAHTFHTDPPPPDRDVLRVSVPADSAPSLEVLTFTFPEVKPHSAVLELRWATTAVRLHFQVTGGRPTS